MWMDWWVFKEKVFLLDEFLSSSAFLGGILFYLNILSSYNISKK
jgi:hypothetical protein